MRGAPKRLPEIQPIDVAFVGLGIFGLVAIAAAWTLSHIANTDLLADFGDD